MTFWEQIADLLEANIRVAVLVVISSEGSSPGRQGFIMAVNENGEMLGSIGGGFMELKLVELAKSKLKGQAKPFIMRQIHRKDAGSNQSGMICSGEQTVAFYFLESSDFARVRQIADCQKNGMTGVLRLDNKGISFLMPSVMDKQYIVSVSGEGDWLYEEQVGHKNSIFIVGGGHVGLALSEVMRRLGFYVTQIDDREELHTMVNNPHAHKKEVVDYNRIDEYIPEGDGIYIALVSFGYRTDKLLLKKLLGKNYKYLGMLGSTEKVRILFEELIREGVDPELLKSVHAPMGLSIHSKTPDEIAISIAAEIIAARNVTSGSPA